MKPSKNLKKYRNPHILKVSRIKCEDKIKIKDKQTAINRAYFESKKHNIPTHCYLCPKCLFYHLTTKESAMDKLERIYNFKP